ncbi:ABC transporter substrate-binding protein, partial [Rhizobium johnstonii]|uniref:ABC transporter substrate-binding protein n=1 Tax=Rhizobium johnstonii TaxID=3019933 RepID=UPI003F97BEA7
STASMSFGPTTSEGAAANVKIRQALNLAIDRDKFVSTVLSGLGATQNTFTPPFSWNAMEAADTYQAAYDDLGSPKVD